jgi:hypothetical protein
MTFKRLQNVSCRQCRKAFTPQFGHYTGFTGAVLGLNVKLIFAIIDHE